MFPVFFHFNSNYRVLYNDFFWLRVDKGNSLWYTIARREEDNMTIAEELWRNKGEKVIYETESLIIVKAPDGFFAYSNNYRNYVGHDLREVVRFFHNRGDETLAEELWATCQ
jgi:hypothetical protein